MEIVEMTNMCMIENHQKNEVLVQRRIKGNWTGVAFPGGHVEQGEGIINSTIREIKEETGLEISDLRFAGIKHWYFESSNKRYMVFLFTTSSYAGTLIEHGEEGDVFWVNKDDLFSLDLADGFEDMVEVMTNPLLNELRYCENIETKDWIRILQ